MKFTFKDKELVKYLQEGGEIAQEPAAAPEQAGGSPEEQLMMACQQAVETQNCELALQVCQAVMQMMGGGAPAAPEAPGAPVYKKGGKLSRWI